MDIICELNERLTLIEGGIKYGGEDKIQKVLSESPIELPEDYIEFLKIISGDDNIGIGFQVDGGSKEIFIWSAEFGFNVRLNDFDDEASDDILKCIWMIGSDVGELIYFYGVGNEGFGIYRTEAGTLDLYDSDKIADSLTDFLVNGVGIDVAITL